MIKICSPYFNSSITIEEGVISSLVIENGDLFRNFITTLKNQAEGYDGDITVYEDDESVSLSKTAEILNEFAPFDINRKPLINKILSSMEKTALNEENFLHAQQLLNDIENFTDKLSFDLECNVVCEKLSIGSILKALGIALENDYDEPLERILDYMQLSRKFDRNKLFIMVNMRSFFSTEKMQIFCEDVIRNKFRLLLIDNREYKKFENENRLIIDADLCEI